LRNTDGKETATAYAYALRALSRRDCSEAELRGKLANREISDAVADSVISRLKEAGYLDDCRYAEQLAGSLVRSGRRFGRALRFELLRRGIAQPLVETALAAIDTDHDEEDTVRGLVARKFPAFDFTVATDREKRRAVDFLLRRGFSLSAIMRVLRENGGLSPD
jgi:regulatory protein